MTYKKIETLEELDGILPLTERFHAGQKYMEGSTRCGYLAWLISSFPSLGVWVAYKNLTPVGYLIAGIVSTNCENACTIYEAYTEPGYPLSASKEIFNKVAVWAESNYCKSISMHTESEVVKRHVARYGFSFVQFRLTRKL